MTPEIRPASVGCEFHNTFDIKCRVCRAYWPEEVEARIEADRARIAAAEQHVLILRDQVANERRAYERVSAELAAAKEEIAKLRVDLPYCTMPYHKELNKWYGDALKERDAARDDRDSNLKTHNTVMRELGQQLAAERAAREKAEDDRDKNAKAWAEAADARDVASLRAEKAEARADKAEGIILLVGLPGWEGRLHSARLGILAARAKEGEKR